MRVGCYRVVCLCLATLVMSVRTPVPVRMQVVTLFGDVERRWVDTYFPFTEPSFELEIFYNVRVYPHMYTQM
jgi:hypothetical protein